MQVLHDGPSNSFYFVLSLCFVPTWVSLGLSHALSISLLYLLLKVNEKNAASGPFQQETHDLISLTLFLFFISIIGYLGSFYLY
jgi:hypothetical protein